MNEQRVKSEKEEVITMHPRSHGRRQKQKQEYLTYILNLEAAAAKFKADANQARKVVVEEFCPWEEGQFIRIDKGITEETARIAIIKYRPGEPRTINGEWAIYVQPFLKDLSRPAKNRQNYYLLPDTKFKVIPNQD